MTLLAVLVPLAIIFALAFLAESMVEYTLGTLFEKVEPLRPFKWALMYVALFVGVGLALYYKLDLIALIPQILESEAQPGTVVGMVLTGLGIGRGAEYLHKFVSSYLVKSPAGELG